MAGENQVFDDMDQVKPSGFAMSIFGGTELCESNFRLGLV